MAGLIFFLMHCLVTRSFNFCLNFVCLSFSLLACSLSVHAVVLTVFAAHSLLPLASIRCKLRTCEECLPLRAPSACEYKAGQFLRLNCRPHLLLRVRGPSPLPSQACFSDGGPPTRNCFLYPFFALRWSCKVLCVLFVLFLY